jgi:hypothetical protein
MPDMLQSLLNNLFGCSHQRTTFPITPGRKTAGASTSASTRNGTYVVCLDCGKEFAYNWNEMRVGEAVHPQPAAAETQPVYR